MLRDQLFTTHYYRHDVDNNAAVGSFRKFDERYNKVARFSSIIWLRLVKTSALATP